MNRPRQWPPGSPGQSREGRDGPADSGKTGAEMGNASLCPSCHADKSIRAQGHLQELDRTPDYYGCDSEDSKELGPRVSSKLQTGGEEDGGIRINIGPRWLDL